MLIDRFTGLIVLLFMMLALLPALFSRTLSPTVIGGLLIHLASVKLVFLLGRTVDVPLGFVDCLLLVPPVLLLAALPISVAGWGVREGALVGRFALIGVPAVSVVAVSILYGLTAPAIGVVYAVVATFLRDDVTEDAGNAAAKVADAASARDKVIRYYDRVAAEWHTAEVRSLNAVYFETRWRSLQHLLRPYEGAATAAELGVGTGAYIDRLAPMFRNLLAVDFSRGMLNVLEKRLSSLAIGNVSLVQQDVCCMSSIGDSSIDVAIAMGLLDNVDDQPRLFAEVARILRSGGGFVAATSNGRCPWYRFRDMLQGSRHRRTERYLSETELRRLAADAGLRVDEVGYWGTVPGGLRSPALVVKILASLEGPLTRTPLRCYLGGLTCRLVKP
jgi:ubiquinone/menaquinone biosynthesis C-methylase UbiE